MKTIQSQRAESFPVRIYIAGDRRDATRICREFCFEVGYCVTVQSADYVYTGGQESGVIIGLINYPRFPQTPEQIVEAATTLGNRLMEGLTQHSFSIETPVETIWFSRRAA